ncbi:hypothetical protein JQ554_23695 [Bradyrhizobium diazoefficiens]|nr:hypothetical protein [Bradyrhizobium diazoefficiens]UCF54833.1 MAG: hypothetical protein JSV48_11820 [Bradyrhizobium sp.]MBR0967058.1 hypothetical protein [Bradyrhizobium diazoefficiens]MBR0979182.1 hypothetical protein [Bradyrhizobium diazoefficiens]MBR1010041.1 hypothetical protein [Bradyrhizobium diazoefficiens]MBR1016619.1 hypothetical protein [Bradyrhizobium diazoefficiens]
MTFKTSGATISKLDHAKLLGFRNLTVVKKSEDGLSESSELAFNKIGSEVPRTPR